MSTFGNGDFAVAINRVTLKGQYKRQSHQRPIPKQHRLRQNADRLTTGLQPDYSGHFALGAAIFALCSLPSASPVISESRQRTLRESFALRPLLFALLVVL
jgi:hypothetical protein